jgi:hypothetical protein
MQKIRLHQLKKKFMAFTVSVLLIGIVLGTLRLMENGPEYYFMQIPLDIVILTIGLPVMMVLLTAFHARE